MPSFSLSFSAVGELIPSRNARIAVAGLGAVAGLYLLARKTWPTTRFLPSTGKVVLVTGCDSGFGCAIARRLYSLGYAVFAGCLNAETAGATVFADLKKDPLFQIVQLDVTKQEQIDKAVETVENWLKQFPDFRLFGIVNNAGIVSFGPMEWLGTDNFLKVFDVNCFGVVRVTSAFLPLIRRGGKQGGRVVVMASIAGEIPSPGAMPYCASKFAILALVECLRIEVKPFGIKVTAICPDFYRTNLVPEADKTIEVLDRQVSTVKPEIFEAYGGNAYLDTLKKALTETVLKLAKPDLTPVVDCVVDALASPNPKIRYHPIEFVNYVLKVLYFISPPLIDSIVTLK